MGSIRVLTGIKPTGMPHLGNFVGAICPALSLLEKKNFSGFLFIADAHALTTLPKPKELHQRIYEVAAAWIAMGLEPSDIVFYRQSRIPEIFELFWFLTCLCPKGLMNRAHAYKAIVAENEEKGLPDCEANVLMGVYNYPILMAADILLFQSHQVPVGRDQVQHIEIARDLAGKFNQTYGETFVLPEALIQKDREPLIGLDGRKMSKSYGNTIPLFCPSKTLKNLLMKIKTDSSRPEDRKDPDTCTLFSLYSHFAEPQDISYIRSRYATGIGWGEMKEILFEMLDKKLAPARIRYEELIQNTSLLDSFLEEGEEKARTLAQETMRRVRARIGFSNEVSVS